MELWSLMHFLMPNVFESHRDFKEWFSNPLTGMVEGSAEYNESLIQVTLRGNFNISLILACPIKKKKDVDKNALKAFTLRDLSLKILTTQYQ
jgi:SNF2 family DNA or RNA helicase